MYPFSGGHENPAVFSGAQGSGVRLLVPTQWPKWAQLCSHSHTPPTPWLLPRTEHRSAAEPRASPASDIPRPEFWLCLWGAVHKCPLTFTVANSNPDKDSMQSWGGGEHRSPFEQREAQKPPDDFIKVNAPRWQRTWCRGTGGACGHDPHPAGLQPPLLRDGSPSPPLPLSWEAHVEWAGPA